MIEKVTGYRTEDGKFFSTEKEAKEHEIKILREQAEKQLDSLIARGVSYTENEAMVRNFILENKEKLLEVLIKLDKTGMTELE